MQDTNQNSKQTTDVVIVDDKTAQAAPTKPLRPLTRKQKAFVQYLLDHPKASNTEAAMRVYNAKDRLVARTIATENIAKPAIRSELAKHSRDIENAILSVVNRWKDSQKVGEVSEAMLNARWMHDKIHGKASQKVEVNTTSISFAIDLTGNGFEVDTPPLLDAQD